MAISSSLQSAQILISRKLSDTNGAIVRTLTSLTGRSRYIPDRITLAPSDLRTGDLIQGRDLLASRFVFAGSVVDATGQNPFSMSNPNLGWHAELHEFAWLAHIAVVDDQDKSPKVRDMISDWISAYDHGLRGVAIDSEVTAKRLIAWLRHSPMILNGADGMFYADFMRSFGLQIRHLVQTVAERQSWSAKAVYANCPLLCLYML